MVSCRWEALCLLEEEKGWVPLVGLKRPLPAILPAEQVLLFISFIHALAGIVTIMPPPLQGAPETSPAQGPARLSGVAGHWGGRAGEAAGMLWDCSRAGKACRSHKNLHRRVFLPLPPAFVCGRACRTFAVCIYFCFYKHCKKQVLPLGDGCLHPLVRRYL